MWSKAGAQTELGLSFLPEQTRYPYNAGTPERLVGDKAYDSDPLDAELKQMGIEMIALHRCNHTKPKTQDGRKLRRYKRRWKVERFFAWLGNFRKVVVLYERHEYNFAGFVKLGCIVILLRARF
jgi:transposase